jgi:hypothetical protein
MQSGCTGVVVGHHSQLSFPCLEYQNPNVVCGEVTMDDISIMVHTPGPVDNRMLFFLHTHFLLVQDMVQPISVYPVVLVLMWLGAPGIPAMLAISHGP